MRPQLSAKLRTLRTAAPGRSILDHLLAYAIIALVVMLVAVLWHLREINKGHLGAAKAELGGVLRIWNSAGRPQGEAMREFAKILPAYIIATNQHYTINDRQVVTVFSTSRLGTPGALSITTSGVFVLERPGSQPRVLR